MPRRGALAAVGSTVWWLTFQRSRFYTADFLLLFTVWQIMGRRALSMLPTSMSHGSATEHLVVQSRQRVELMPPRTTFTLHKLPTQTTLQRRLKVNFSPRKFSVRPLLDMKVSSVLAFQRFNLNHDAVASRSTR